VSNRHPARVIAGDSRPCGRACPLAAQTPLSFTNIYRVSGGLTDHLRSPRSETIDSLGDQGEALKRHFNAVIAAFDLSVPRGELKNTIKTFLGNPLCRGVDELCTKLDEECAKVIISMQGWESAINNGHDLLMEYSDQCRGYKEQNTILLRDNMEGSMLAGTSLR
jgi:hypothetical protein